MNAQRPSRPRPNRRHLIPNAKFIAGGTNLLDLMKLEIETPTHLIDVNGLGLDKIEPTAEGGVRIGALVEKHGSCAAHALPCAATTACCRGH
jgi:CO/xanthine dehydrogenase FAD-binding subunit